MTLAENVTHILDTPIEYIKGIGPAKGEAIRHDLQIFTLGDLLFTYPFRYVDRTKFIDIKDIRNDNDLIQIKGTLLSLEKIKGKNNRTRLNGVLKDGSGFIDLVWFQSVQWIEKTLEIGQDYIVFGRPATYGGKKNIAHPEMELVSDVVTQTQKTFDPIYSSTEKLDAKGFDNKARRKILKTIIQSLNVQILPENLPEHILSKLNLVSRLQAIKNIHFPTSEVDRDQAVMRIKFEEIFFFQLRILLGKIHRQHKYHSLPFTTVGSSFNEIFKTLPYELTNAQKKVIKEIRADLAKTQQMNRLLQGDVGSGKTVVALLVMAIARDNDFQSCLMAPTEILAQQHYLSISSMTQGTNIKVTFLTGSIKGKARAAILESLAKGETDIIIGTHALIEDTVVFSKLGLAVIDEQHRFGVAQRAGLWKKNKDFAPHVLVMTATPIPRTLAMTLYGDLDVSVIDELPPGRKDIKTLHQYESSRPRVIEFMHKEIEKGRQIYIVYPLIEESEKLDLKNLEEGYERLLTYFPPPHFQISVVHGRMKAAAKDFEMNRFVKGITQIMVATTVIEVGVNVPNASVMIIENTERFGLSQLHQLRGRVGRGAEQSFCILMSDVKLSKDGKERIKTMVETNNGFVIAEADLKLRGPGDLQGTQQSGLLDFKLLNISADRSIVETARYFATMILENDQQLEKNEHQPIRNFLVILKKKYKDWGRIS
ncbi:MAG: ATP-dependent DNA helicase RecG [Saprospiraceae bacterium]|nr:ATP-dependent DNA helicase RecG [Saprospiraceae bacterium]